jgi:outer membrane protein OmpA-like peptidoglycan-associated protein
MPREQLSQGLIIKGTFSMFQLMDLAPCCSALLSYAVSLIMANSKTRRATVSKYLGSLNRNLVSLVFVGGLALSLGIGFAAAGEQPTADQIARSLTPKHLTRSLSVSPAETAKAADEGRFLNGLRNRQSRSLTLGEREKVATIAQDKPNIDLEINFEFNSDQISKSAAPTVDALAKALTDSAIKGSTFLVAGYTDAKGSEPYNQDLSERRADAVKRVLVQKYGIATDTLVTAGYGKTHLKSASDPYGAENRRVAIVNMASKVAGN